MPIDVGEVSSERQINATEEYGGTELTVTPTGTYTMTRATPKAAET